MAYMRPLRPHVINLFEFASAIEEWTCERRIKVICERRCGTRQFGAYTLAKRESML